MANVVEIVIKGLDQTKAPFTQSIKSMKDVEKAASGMATILTGAGIAAAGALTAVTARAIDNADEMGKMAQKAQMPVQAFSQLAHAADMAGVSAEQLKGGFVQLNKSIAEAAANSGSETAKAFQAMGVSVTDAAGKLRSNQAVFSDLSNRFASYADDANKGALAGKLFGKAIGPELLPLLNQGAEGIRAVASEVQGVDADMASNAEAFNDNMTRLKAMFFDVGTTIAKAVIPHLVQFSDWLVKAQKENGIFSAIAGTTVDVLKGMAVAVHGTYTTFKVLGIAIGNAGYMLSEVFGNLVSGAITTLKGFGQVVTAVFRGIVSLTDAVGRLGEILYHVTEGDFKQAWESSKGAAEDMKNAVVKIGSDIATAWKEKGDELKGHQAQTWANIKGSAVNAKEDIKKELSELGKFSMDLFSKPLSGPAIADRNEGKASAPAIVSNEATEVSLKNLHRIMDLQEKLYLGGLRGAQRLIAEVQLDHQKRLEQIAQLGLAEEQAIDLAIKAEENKQQRLNELHEQGHLIRAEMDEAYRNADFNRAVELMNSEARDHAAMLQGKQELISAYYQFSMEASRKWFSYLAEGATSIANGLGNALTGIIMGAQKASEAFKALGMQIVQMMVNWIVQRGIAWAFEKTLAAAGKALLQASALASQASAVSLAAAWTPAATAATIATFGAAASAGAMVPAMMAANTATATGLALSGSAIGQAHDGMDNIPFEGSWILQRGERVIQPEANKELTNFLAKQSDGGSGQPIHVTVYLNGDPILREVSRASADGRLEIHAKSII